MCVLMCPQFLEFKTEQIITLNLYCIYIRRSNFLFYKILRLRFLITGHRAISVHFAVKELFTQSLFIIIFCNYFRY